MPKNSGFRCWAFLQAACFKSLALPGIFAFLADALLVLSFQTPLKKTNALIAQMGITFVNAVSVCVNAMNFWGVHISVFCILGYLRSQKIVLVLWNL